MGVTVSVNVVRCPKCGELVGEGNAAWKAAAERHTFDVIHLGACGHAWTAHHRDFTPDGRPGRPRNPFEPVRLEFW